jgi:CRISPR system Cascade subunit CasB
MRSVGEQAGAAARWWRGLQPSRPNGEPNPLSDRAALARLRRIDLLSAMSDQATFDLFRALGRNLAEELPDVALCAAVLASVREDSRNEHPARTIGAPTAEKVDQALMKPLRFRRMIEAEDPEERLTLLRRAVQLAGRKLNVRELAAACLDWSQDRRRRWIFEYYAAGLAAPKADTEPVEKEPVA